MHKLIYAVIGCAGLVLALVQIARGKSLADPITVFAAGIFLLFLICWFRRGTRLFALTALFTICGSLYTFELYLRIVEPLVTKADVVLRLRNQGVPAYPAVFPSGFIKLRSDAAKATPNFIDGGKIMPLAGIPKRPTVYCEERGDYIVYESDEWGFRNLPNLDQSTSVEIALLGDSFVQGYCVPDEFTYVAQFSALGPTRSFGIDGSSVLIQYAIYREYIADIKPRRIIWFFFEGNDVEDFVTELEIESFRAYLQPDHSQRLAQKSGEVGAIIERYINASLESRPERTLRTFATLQRTQMSIVASLFWDKQAKFTELHKRKLPREMIELPEKKWQIIHHIWKTVMEKEHERGGAVTFVYIPSHLRLDQTIDTDPFISMENRIKGIWTELGADFVSLSDFLATVDDRLTIYFGMEEPITPIKHIVHLSRDGYRRTATYIIDYLKQRDPTLNIKLNSGRIR